MPVIHEPFEAPPSPVSIHPGEIHLWRAFLKLTEESLDVLEALLDEKERLRAAGYRFAVHRRRYVAAHAFLRRVLGKYLEVAPAHVVLVQGDRGKPELADGPEGRDAFRFSLSHSEDLALLAVARDREVGVDLEWRRSIPNRDGVVERFFSEREQVAYRQLPESEREQGFFDCWTRKEALLKALGAGLSEEVGELSADSGEWEIRNVIMPEGYAAALAVKGMIKKIRYFQWNWERT